MKWLHNKKKKHQPGKTET